MKILKTSCILTFMLLFSNISFSQSSSDIEMAKSLAKQYGYSDSEINDILNGTYKQSATSKLDQIQNTGAVVRMPENSNLDTTIIIKDYTSTSAISDIFGHNIFSNKKLNFVPSYNIPTPDNYKLGVGDEVIIDTWGDVITNIKSTISPEGSVVIPDLGPIYIAGKTIKNAEQSIKDYLSKIYSGISNTPPSTFVKLALGKISSVTINVLGDVNKPGTYTIPSLSTMATAMYLADGPSNLGTVREIKLYRNSKEISSFDVYDFIINGKFNSNVRLEDNDVILVGTYKSLVTVNGGVKRPMKYELLKDESLEDILKYSGGFVDNAFRENIYITRRNGKDLLESFDVQSKDFGSFKLQDGDVVNVYENTSLENKNQVTIEGPVMRPGSYSISQDGTTSLLEIIKKAGGLKDNVYLERGYIERLDDKRQKTQLSFNLQNIILGGENVSLKSEDIIKLYTIDSITPIKQVQILGKVANPGKFQYRKGMTIGDLILAAKGLKESATLRNIEIARRLKKDNFAEEVGISDTIAMILKYNLLQNPNDANTELEPFDIVFIRESPLFKNQTVVTVDGEIKYPGEYVIEKNVVRISDIINRAQGFTNDAYLGGAKLTRVLVEDEIERISIAKEMALKQMSKSDSLSKALEETEVGDRFSIAIDIDKAMKEPGSYYDVVLREGDIITIPKLNNTVTISGAVLYPNTITYNPKYSWRDYISNAGGVTQKGFKRKTYMVHMNGAVAAKGHKEFKVRPGTEIVVPYRDANKRGFESIAQIIGLTSTTISTAAMVVAIVTRFK